MLDNWNSYRNISNALGQLLGLKKDFNESTILELFVLHTINHDFELPIRVNIIALKANNNVSPNYLTDNSNKSNMLTNEENDYLLNNLKIIMRVRGYETQEVWGDNDIIVCIREQKKFTTSVSLAVRQV